MPPTRQRILLLHLAGQVIRTTADHPFYVVGQGLTGADKLHVGDISNSGEDQEEYRMNAAVRPSLAPGCWMRAR